jgi:hypothetical protein
MRAWWACSVLRNPTTAPAFAGCIRSGGMSLDPFSTEFAKLCCRFRPASFWSWSRLQHSNTLQAMTERTLLTHPLALFTDGGLTSRHCYLAKQPQPQSMSPLQIECFSSTFYSFSTRSCEFLNLAACSSCNMTHVL